MTRGDGSNHSHDFPNRLRKVLTEETVTEPEQRARISTPSLHQLTSTSGWYCSLSEGGGGGTGNGSHPHQNIKRLRPDTDQAEHYDFDHVTIVKPGMHEEAPGGPGLSSWERGWRRWCQGLDLKILGFPHPCGVLSFSASKQNLRNGLRSKQKEFEVLTGAPAPPPHQLLSPPPASVVGTLLYKQDRLTETLKALLRTSWRLLCYHGATPGLQWGSKLPHLPAEPHTQALTSFCLIGADVHTQVV